MQSMPSPVSLPAVRVKPLAAVAAITGAAAAAAFLWLPPQMAMVVALLVFCISLWAGALVPEYWPALVFFTVAMVSKLAPAQTVFSGFQSTTFWLLFSGAVMGAAIGYTGLGKRAAAILARMVGRRYPGVIAGIVVFSVALSFIMPSGMGRVVLLVPITMAVAGHMGYGQGDNGRTGMLMAAAFAAFLPSFSILPSNAPNMILSGMAETLYGVRISYIHYLLLHFPVLGVGKAVLLVLLILRMFPAPDPLQDSAAGEKPGPMSSPEKRLALVLGLCLALWMSDGLHHISPAWIGLAAALYCLWPGAGLTAESCIKEINYGSLLFVAGVMGLGAVISASGLGETVVRGLSRHAGFADSALWNTVLLALIATVVSMVTNLAGVPATMTPLAQDLAAATGLPLMTVLMTQVLAFSNVFLPYQAPPLIFAMQTARLPVRAVTRLCLALFALSLLVLMPLDLLWWRVLGMF